MAYQSFTPSPLPPHPPIEMDQAMVALLIKANKQLALLDGISARIPNVNLFISMYVRKEALMSSQIEGTQATLEDVLDPLLDENANRDVSDVINYIKATEYALGRLFELPLCNRLIRETHAVLMAGVRGQEKSPGEFRHSQNWIGGQGSTLKTARYIPPAPQDMTEARSALETYINGDDALDVLIRAALIHYQFESIHPFLDGNGRIGRLLVTLFLMQKGMLQTPALYISYFLKKNRIEYYDRMSEIRRTGNYEQWVRFFLEAIVAAAEDATATMDKLIALHDANVAIIASFGRGAASAMKLFAFLEANPIIEIRKTAAMLGMAYNTISAAVARLCDAGVLMQTGSKTRGRIFAYAAYLDLLREGT
jgi:Fic family protein